MSTKATPEQKRRCPVTTLLTSDELTGTQKALVITGILLTICAVAVFIWMIVRAGMHGSASGVVMMSGVVLFAVGFLYFTLARINNPGRAWLFLYISVPIAVAAVIISLYLPR